jgi:hypothetical protein
MAHAPKSEQQEEKREREREREIDYVPLDVGELANGDFKE